MAKQSIPGKSTAIATHFTIVGCLIAITINIEPKHPFARFYIRQTLGLHLGFHGFALFFSYTQWPYAWEILCITGLFLWAYSFWHALNNKQEPIPIVGKYFQQWFTFVS